MPASFCREPFSHQYRTTAWLLSSVSGNGLVDSGVLFHCRSGEKSDFSVVLGKQHMRLCAFGQANGNTRFLDGS